MSGLNDEGYFNFVNCFGVLFFSETWQWDDEFEIPGYESVLVPKLESLNNVLICDHGGVALFKT